MSITEKYLNKKVYFHSGNFAGLSGECTSVDENSKEKKAIYGVKIEFKLDDGRNVQAYKSDHFALSE